MGLAIDTIAFNRLSGGGADTVFSPTTIAAGDSFTVRAFAPPATAYLERMMFSQATAGSAVRLRSPLLHDNVQGLQVFPTTGVTELILPRCAPQLLQPQDTLLGEMLVNAVAQQGQAAACIMYRDLPGASARLHVWPDIANLIKSLHILRVTLGAGGSAGVWLDTAITVTENLLHANTDYAVLGYITDTALTAVGIKGIDTSNLRICGPATLGQHLTAQFFYDEWAADGMPHIPVFNAANAPSTFLSAIHTASPSAANVQLVCAELAHPVN